MNRNLPGCLWRGLGILVAILVALVVVAVGVLHTDAVRGWARGFIVESVEDALQAKLEIGAIEGSVFGTLTARDAAMLTDDGIPIASAERLEIEVGLLHLLTRTVRADVRATRLDLFLHRDADGELNVASIVPVSEEEPAARLPVSVDLDFSLEDAVVIWRDDGAPRDDDPFADVSGREVDRESLMQTSRGVTTPSTVKRAPPHTVVLDSVTAMARVVVERDNVTRVGVDQLFGHVAAGGFTGRRVLEASEYVLRVDEDGTLVMSLETLEIDEWLRLSDGSMKLHPDAIAGLQLAVGELTLRQLLLRSLLPEAQFRRGLVASASITPAKDGASYAHLRLQPLDGEGRLDVAGTIEDWIEPGPDSRWDLALITRQLEPGGFVGVEQPVERLSLFASASGRGFTPDEMVAEATVAIRAADVSGYRIDALAARVTVDRGVLHLSKGVVKTPYASASARGDWAPNGQFSVVARAESTDAVARVAKKVFGHDLDTRATVELDVNGQLDVTQDDPMAMIVELDASANWDMNKFLVEDVRIDSTRGRVRAVVGPAGSGGRRVSYDVKASARTVQMEGLRLGSLSVDSRGSSVVKGGDPDTMNVLRNLSSRANLDVREFVSDGAILRDVSLFATVRPAGGRTDYTLRGSLADTSFGPMRVKDAAADLAGHVEFGRSLAWPQAVRGLSVRGDVAGTGLRFEGDAAGSLDAKIDVGGPLDDLRGTVRAATANLTLGGFAFEQLDAEVAFTGDRHFAIEADGTQKERKPKNVALSLEGRYTKDLTDFSVKDLRFRTLDEAWAMSEGFSIDTKTGTMRFDDVVVTRGEDRIRVDGMFQPGERQELEVEIEAVEIGLLAREFGAEGLDPLRATVNATLSAAGTAREPTATFSIRLSDVHWEEWGPFEVLLEGRYGGRELVLELFELDGYGTRIAQGNATLPVRVETTPDFEVLRGRPLELFVETPDLDLANFHEPFEPLATYGVTGGATLTARVRGTLLEPTVNIDVRTDQLRAHGGADEADVELGPLDSTLGIRYLNPDLPAGGLEVTLNAAWEDEPPIRAFARVRGDAAQWLSDVLDGEEVDWADRLGSSPWRLKAGAQKFDLRNLRVGPLREADAEGFITFDVTADGTLANPNASLDFDLDGFGWERYRDIFVDAVATVDKERFELKEASLEWDADPILEASGTFPTPFEALFGDAEIGELPIEASVELLPLPVAKFSAIDYSFAAIKGVVSGYTRVSGTAASPSIEGRLSAIDVEFADKSRGTVAAEFGAEPPGRVHASLTVCTGEDPILAGHVALPVELNLVRLAAGEMPEIAGEIEASMLGDDVQLARLVPRSVFDRHIADVEGMMDVDMRLSGTVEDPALEGRLQIAGGKFFIGAFSRGLRSVAVDLTASKGMLKLHRAYLADERGHIDAEGELALEGFKPGRVDGRAEVRDFGTIGLVELTSFVSADVDIGGNFGGRNSAATATATVSQLQVVIPDMSDQTAHPTTLDSSIVVLRDGQDEAVQFDTGLDLRETPYLKLNVVVERDSWIRHPMATVEVMADLDLEIAADGVILGGEAQTVRGTAEVIGKKFTIQEAIVTFTGGTPPNPILQIEAVHELDSKVTEKIGPPSRGVPRAIVRVTGRLDDPQIRFMSDPEMPESDVVYTLLTGRPPGQADAGQTDTSGVAASAATGVASGLIQKQLGEALPLNFDVVRFEAGEQGFADPSLEVGKYVTSDVYLSVEQKFGAEENESTSLFNVEYRFLPRWVLELRAGNLGTAEGTIFWDLY